jgi:hypothetical protein
MPGKGARRGADLDRGSGPAYPGRVDYRCSQCHHRWAASGDAPHACPSCRAEAGLEPAVEVPMPMRAFALVLGGAIVLALVGTALAVGSGG